MRKRYMEAMALVQRYGKPDIFLTMTYRPDLVVRVFRAKLEELKDRLFKQQIFGKIVSAEIPDKNTNLHLHNTVIKHMMHGSCGVLNPTNVCMKKNGCCKSQYSKSYASGTTVGNDCFPLYKRSDNGITVKLRGHNLDNRWVVPYNPYLLATFDCHINVEICSTIKAVKYLYKYVYKGHDRDEDLINVLNSDRSAKSMLTDFFALNQIDENARTLLYKEFLEFYVWSQQYKEWTRRKKKTVIGQIVTANLFEGERYYLRILLNHVRGPLSFEDLRTVDGVVAPTFREAATMHGLLQRDSSLQDCLHEASLYQMPSNLRRLFATIRSRKLVALATASSGVAASILPEGRTAHSRFKIPLDTDEHSICCVSKQSVIAKLLSVARLII
ncbi:hypothetical protein I3842_13G150700 [Carya illinoinensis]|uniref:ATP-dependent DNA helicase n=1 Tax=Carya illinoinensis TaxID=32201 RepID=A0A922DDV9_CARIL|nr:hypothetical protein I3842_13G150700 [Carya illinoinensis]